MARTLRIDPVTRIEGHLAIETRIDAGKVVDARVAGRMFRGFEDILLGRHPVDAARITQRICGICHEVHGITASMALEDLYGVEQTPNAKVLRELILGLHLITDHIFHFYQLSLPDYLDFSHLQKYRGKDPRVRQVDQLFRNSAGTFTNHGSADPLAQTDLTVEMALGYVEAVRVRKQAGSGLASLGGKVPFCHAILPGGITTDITSDRLMKYADALDVVTDFVRRFYLPHARILAHHFKRYLSLGGAHGHFYANRGFELLQKPLFEAGVVMNDGSTHAFNFDQVQEQTEHAFFNADGRLAVDKPGAYSWVKGLHYQGTAMEVGPLARAVVGKDSGFMRLLGDYGIKQARSSVMTRILARAYEAEKICAYLLELFPHYRLEEPTITPIDINLKPSGVGRGLSLAARGALNHEVTAEEGKVTAYKLLVPSTWNFGPTSNGQRGTVEQALVGTPVLSEKKAVSSQDAIEVGRIVRSFDPCLACAIH